MTIAREAKRLRAEFRNLRTEIAIGIIAPWVVPEVALQEMETLRVAVPESERDTATYTTILALISSYRRQAKGGDQ